MKDTAPRPQFRRLWGYLVIPLVDWNDIRHNLKEAEISAKKD